ncbi:MAG TPA: GNAT family N-acetyltransferase [Bacillota bacterium]|nr:GNAT family N-acetyltransferase [Bacillota bacterium]HOA15403.1 GNAT family N-acetyltransferase [Bacillota bacterium]HOG52862.1 GNAT family N-acetyltransferase [Bacillota bacterium]
MSGLFSIGKLSTRPALADDLDFVLGVYRANFGLLIEQGRGWDSKAEAAYLQREMADAPFFILTYDGRDAGFLSFEEWEAVHLRHIEVHPEFAGRGIGTLALRWLIKKAGDRPLKVGVTEGNHRGMDFYTNLGFRKVGEITLPMKGARGTQMLKKALMQKG